MRNSAVTALAIIAITALELAALHVGVNGKSLAGALAIIGGLGGALAGYKLGH